MIEAKYKNWEQVPIKVYKEIQSIIEDEGLQGMDKDVAIIAVLCDCPEDDIWNMPVTQIGSLSRSLAWVNEFNFDHDVKFRKIKIGGFQCNVTDSMTDFSVGQYIDFNNLWRAEKKDISALLTTFIIPTGKTYNKGYSIQELYKAIEDNLPITTANALCFFFLKSLRTSIADMLIYLDYILERTEKKGRMMTPEIAEKIAQAREMLHSFGSLL